MLLAKSVMVLLLVCKCSEKFRGVGEMRRMYNAANKRLLVELL